MLEKISGKHLDSAKYNRNYNAEDNCAKHYPFTRPHGFRSELSKYNRIDYAGKHQHPHQHEEKNTNAELLAAHSFDA